MCPIFIPPIDPNLFGNPGMDFCVDPCEHEGAEEVGYYLW